MENFSLLFFRLACLYNILQMYIKSSPQKCLKMNKISVLSSAHKYINKSSELLHFLHITCSFFPSCFPGIFWEQQWKGLCYPSIKFHMTFIILLDPFRISETNKLLNQIMIQMCLCQICHVSG